LDCTARKQTKECNKTLRKIAIYVGKKWKHGDLLKYVVEHIEKPSLTKLTAIKDTATKAEMYRWQKIFDKLMEQEEAVDKGIKKLYSLIWGQCTEVMKNKLKAVTDFKEIERAEDAIHLIKKSRA